MKKTLSFRILSLLFALVFLVTALPLGIFANDVETTEEAAAANEELTSTESEGVSLLPTGYEDKPTFPEEIFELRTENVKHFDKGDGTYEAIAYGGAVHRKDADGKWQDIDNTLTLREDRGAERYVDADARISFAPTASSGAALWQLSENGYSISLSLADADLRAGAAADVKNHASRAEQIAAAKKADDTDALFRIDNSTKILYRNVLANVDLEYILSGNDVKETILVQNVCENYDFPFRLSLSGLIPKTTEGGAILLLDAESGKEVYLLPAPYMTDANDDYSDAVSYRLTDLGGGEYEIVVSASDEWINAPERAFPVAIDPTLTCFTNTSNTYDTYVDSMTDETKATSYGSSVQMSVHPNRTSFIKTNANAMPTLPPNAFVLAAKLNIVYRYTNLSGANNIEIGVYRYSQNWDENITWNSLSNYGADPDLGITGTPITTFAPINDSEWHSISLSITSAAAYWYSGSQTPTNGYYGLALKKYSGKYATYIRTSNASQTDERPSFSVSYSLVNGVYAIRKANTDYCIRSEKTITNTISIDNLPSFTGTSASEKDHLFKIIYRSAHNDYIFRSMENNELILYPDLSGSTPTVKWGKITVSGAPATNENLPTDYTWRMSASQNGYDLIYHRESYSPPNYYLRSVASGNGQTLSLTTTSTDAGTEWEFPKYNGPSLRGIEWISTQSTMITGQTYTFQAVMYDDRIGVNGPITYSVLDGNGYTTSMATVNSSTGLLATLSEGNCILYATYPNASGPASNPITIEQSLEGVFFIHNREFGNYYLQIDDGDAPNYNTEGGIMEIWTYNSAYYHRWKLSHVGEGYYIITSMANNMAITVKNGEEQSTAKDLILQPYPYTVNGVNKSDNQKWRITSTPNNAYKICALSSDSTPDHTLVMDLEIPSWIQLHITHNYGGLNVRQDLYVDNNSYRDEWCLVPYKITMYGILADADVLYDHDHLTSIQSSATTLWNLKYQAQIKSGVFSGTECKSDLLDTNIFVIRSHGDCYYSPAYSHEQLATLILLNKNSPYNYLMSHDDFYAGTGSVTKILSSEDYSNLDIALFIGCKTGAGGTQGKNLPSRVVSLGATCSIGCKYTINCDYANIWTTLFFQKLCTGTTYDEAAQYASSFCSIPSSGLSYTDLTISGDSSQKICCGNGF